MGQLGVFVGRFFGPLRSIMPLVAGICAMRQVPFQIANIVFRRHLGDGCAYAGRRGRRVASVKHAGL